MGGLDGRGGSETGQPGTPEGEVRLLGVDRVGRTLVVSLSGGLSFELDEGSVPDGLPARGEAVGAELLQEMAAAGSRKLAARDLMNMLGRSLQPVARLRRKLLDKGHPSEAVEAVLVMMQEQGLCSDSLYAEAYCRDTLLVRAVGPRYLVARLQSRQVPFVLARQVVAAVMTPEKEEELALRAATRKWNRTRGDSGNEPLAKVIRFLLGRGFSPAVAHRAARAMRPGVAEQDME